MKKLLISLCLAFSVPLMATPVTILDTYIGGNDHGYGDVIGSSSWFGIDSMTVDLSGTSLSITINSNFATGTSGLGSFGSARPSNLTNTALSAGRGIGFGDLFLSSSGWNPHGSGPAHLSDDNVTGTLWDYGISLDDRWSKTSGASLFSLDGISNNANAYLSNDYLSSGVYRHGQEVAVDNSQENINAGNVSLLSNAASFDSLSPGEIKFIVDISGTALEGASAIGIHWAMTCGNDTIEGEYRVPEPTTIVLMLIGLICLGFVYAPRVQTRKVDIS